MNYWLQRSLLVLAFAVMQLLWRWDYLAPRVFHFKLAQPQVEIVDLAFVLKAYRAGQETLVDVRSPADYRKAHIEGAHHLSSDEASDVFTEDRSGKMLVFYCRDTLCSAAYVVAREKSQVLNRKLYVYAGGLQEWMACGLPTSGAPRLPR